MRRPGLRARRRVGRPVGVLELREVAQRAVREHDGARELRDELLHGLAHPPGRVAPEGDAAVGVEALEGAEQADDALLQELHPLDAAAAVGPGERRDARQARLDELRAGGRVAGLRGADEAPLALDGGRAAPREALERAVDLRPATHVVAEPGGERFGRPLGHGSYGVNFTVMTSPSCMT